MELHHFVAASVA